LYAIRALLEGFAAREFAKQADDAAIERFGQAAKVLRSEAEAQNQAGVLRAKTELYDILLDNCGNALVKEILTSLHSRVNLLRATSLMHPDRLPASTREINRLYKALKARDADAAEIFARQHVVNAQKAALRVLDQMPSEDE
jgi:DNA-binding GntR family transcriptional regulator